MSLSSDLLRGYTDTIILRRLAEGESYGYRINREITALSGGAFELKEATLYTAFRRLENAGWICSRWGDEESGARRRYYRMTPEGEEKLKKDCGTWRETRELLNRLLMEE
ncbi:MAG: helix-turn-helix transcriptional regulator [Clostridia bacterium]|nr:helix-turn-helix transcriptional regulator [Clostridia bacterium]